MNTRLKRASTLFFAGLLALAGCSGSQGDAGPKGDPGVPGDKGDKGDQGDPGADYVPTVANGPGLKIQVTGAPTVRADQSVSVTYRVTDTAGTAMSGITPSFAIARIDKRTDDVSGDVVLPYVVLTKTGSKSLPPADPAPDPATITPNPTAVKPSATAAATTGVLVDNGGGSYTYTFAAGGMTSAPGTGSNEGKTTYTVAPAVQVNQTDTKTYAIWIQASRQEDLTDRRTITPVNLEYDFVPAGGTLQRREIASTAGCSKCHDGFKKYTVENGFHGGGRVEAPFCAVCHNIERSSGQVEGIPAADAGRFVHRIHFGEELQKKVTTGTLTSGAYQFRDGAYQSCSTSSPCTCTVEAPCKPTLFHGIGEVTYPQDVRNCKECHEGAAQGDQWKTRPNRSACGSCHDYVSFVDTTMAKCDVTADKSNGCRHSGGAQANDNNCTGCHDAATIQGYHVPVLPKDPKNTLDYAGTDANARTNAAQIAAAGVLPPFASRLEYALDSVSLDASRHPSMKFKIKRDGVDVVFNTYEANAVVDPITDFVGTAGVYFAYAVPQDGITAPADFNTTKSSNLRTLWNGGAVTGGTQTTGHNAGGTCTTDAACTCTAADPCYPATPAGTLEGPDPVTGYYTATLTSVTLPANATMLTGGLGYQYDLPNQTDFANGIVKNQPLTQVDNTVGGASAGFTAAYPYDPAKGSGGLLVPIADAWKTGTGFTARRAVVSNDKCNACHTFLGVGPSFHVGQRNDAPTCSFCHNPNRANTAGWSANVSTFVHAIHGTDKRTVPFTWESACPAGSTFSVADNACKDAGGNVVDYESFAEVTFPGYLANCQTCHLPGTYDFSASGSAAAVPNLLWSANASGNVTTTAPRSPYVTTGVDYGFGTDGKALVPADKNLVTSPIMAACVSCHDTDVARGHMMGQGGSFYRTRAGAKEASGKFAPEGCLLCHGPNAEWSIATMHR